MAKKILIVDDESDIRIYLEILFQENGYETECAENGEDAMVKAKAFQPDLISLDIIMPEETGQKFYRELIKDTELRGVPVIICSGVTRYKRLFSRDHKTMPKPFAFVEKPIDRKELMKLVEKALKEEDT